MFSRYGAFQRSSALKCGLFRSFATSRALNAPRKRTIELENLNVDVAAESPIREEHESKGVLKLDKAEVPLQGLLAKQARLDQSLKRRTAYQKGKDAKEAAKASGLEMVPKPKKKQKSDGPSPELLVQGSKHHHDLDSFKRFAAENKLKENTTVYKGTLFEYTVAEALKPFGFELHRTGRSNDLGIDLLGVWKLPGKLHELRVLIQCKATKPTPATTRELEGAYVGAPSAWQGDNVLALLASTKASTKGVTNAVQRSKSPIGVVQIDQDGKVRQLLWNAVAEQCGLAGLGVTVRYSNEGHVFDKNPNPLENSENSGNMEETIALTWEGKPLHVGVEQAWP